MTFYYLQRPLRIRLFLFSKILTCSVKHRANELAIPNLKCSFLLISLGGGGNITYLSCWAFRQRRILDCIWAALYFTKGRSKLYPEAYWSVEA